MTPLLAALSSLRLVDTSNSAALSLSPDSTASRNPRTAVCSDDFTDLLRSLRRSLVRLRFSCDLMLATRVFLRKSRRDCLSLCEVPGDGQRVFTVPARPRISQSDAHWPAETAQVVQHVMGEPSNLADRDRTDVAHQLADA